MNRQELINEISAATGQSKSATADFVNAFCETVTNTLANSGDVQLVGFGVFSVSDVAGREGRNPQTGEKIQIPASRRAKFRAGKALKDAVNNR